MSEHWLAGRIVCIEMVEVGDSRSPCLEAFVGDARYYGG